MSTILEYVERTPRVKTNTPAPLLILLHGYGSNEMDLFSFAEELPEEMHIVSVRAPHNLGHNAFAWYSINFDADQNKFSDLDEARESLDKISVFIDEITKKLDVDTSKIFLLGFSQGAILSYGLSLNTNKVQNVIALSGYLNEDLLTKKDINTSSDYFISHGTVDQVIPVEWARKAPVFLSENGIINSFQEYPVGHGVHPFNFRDFKNWIEERL
jgi:phospholipase/carboxylesterase